MNNLLQDQARRIDALSLRERAIMFVAMAAALVAVADLLVLSPALAQERRVAAQRAERLRELADLRLRTAALATSRSAPGGLQATLQQTRNESDAAQASIDKLLAAEGDAARVSDLLERVLRRHERLKLLKLSIDKAPRADATATQPGAAGLQTVELTIGGAYHELAAYLADIERQLSGLRVADLHISGSGGAQAVLALRVQLRADAPTVVPAPPVQVLAAQPAERHTALRTEGSR